MNTFKDLVEDFVEKLHVLIDGHAVERARAAVMHAFGGAPPKRGPGRPPKALTLVATPKAEKTSTKRRKGPVQLCPVPGCKNPAAPVFGMVCAKHKDLPKKLIARYRELRKAKKLGLRPKASKRRTKIFGAKPTKNVAPKTTKAKKPTVYKARLKKTAPPKVGEPEPTPAAA